MGVIGVGNITEPKWWDFTVPMEAKDKDVKTYTMEQAIELLEPLCERFAVGEEVGEKTGYKHLQGRVVFKIGKDKQTLVNLKWGFHWSPTSVRNFDYVEKEGNFYRSWEKVICKWTTIELREWQKALLLDLEQQDERTVTVVVDKKGGRGKTYFSKYCVATHKATYCPPLGSAIDYMAFAMAKPSKAYIFDVPRSESVKENRAMWSAIEQIKNGYLYDKRYNFRDMWIEPPKIIVFTNEEPDTECLSKDRWRAYQFENLKGIGDWLTPLELN